MSINDGYGDQPTYEEEFLSEYEGWLRAVVGRMIGYADPRFDDAVQEARVELWRAYRELESDPNRIAYSRQRAKRRIGQYLFHDKPQTGHTRLVGRPEVKTTALLDKPVGDPAGPATLGDLLLAADALGDVEWAYHHGEIMEALSGLSAQNREYVLRRFWMGYNDSEVARELGVSTSGMHNRWVRTIRPRLVEALSHLAGAL